MNKFLEISHKALEALCNYEKIHIVLGNESCDLDSAISSLVYAYFLFEHQYSTEYCKTIAIPVLNIHEDEFPLRTETRYFLTKHKICHDNITFRNQIDLTKLSNENRLNLTLVDHHVLPENDSHLIDNIIEVMDHRPFDKTSNLKTTDVNIDLVGSCCTLIANKIINDSKSVLTEDLARLLHGTIILDTVNFNKDANRYKDLDKQIAERLESLFNIESRDELYEELIKARSDISTLTPLQILHRDMKIVLGLPFPGVPMLFADFLTLEGAPEALKTFCVKHNCEVIVPMGLVTKNGEVFRDIGVYGTDNDLKKRIVDVLKSNTELRLCEVESRVESLVMFKQENVKMSRKHIIPIVRTVLEDCTKKEVL